jgi:hypothetical protein
MENTAPHDLAEIFSTSSIRTTLTFREIGGWMGGRGMDGWINGWITECIDG